MRNAIRNLLWAAGGAALMWLALHRPGEDDGPNGSSPLVTPESVATDTSAAPRAPAVSRPEVAVPFDAGAISAPAAPGEPAAAAETPTTSGRAPSIVWFPPKELSGTPTSIPNRGPDDAAGRSAATDLLDQPRITCDFGAGVNTGLRDGDTLTVGAGAQYRGDLMVYDLLEPGAGKARLSGTVGATGSPTGETRVQLVLYDARIHFLSLQQAGAYVVTTIYDELDDMGRHVAVMSRHENNAYGAFNYAAQFLGACY